MPLQAVEPLLARIKARDKNLEDQIRRAVESIALNIGEGNTTTRARGGRGSLRRREARGRRWRR